jgi:hypothetical protein
MVFFLHSGTVSCTVHLRLDTHKHVPVAAHDACFDFFMTGIVAKSRFLKISKSKSQNQNLKLNHSMQIGDAIKTLCCSLGAESVAIVEGFGIPDHLLAAPIAADWNTYNKVDNQGELTGASMLW